MEKVKADLEATNSQLAYEKENLQNELAEKRAQANKENTKSVMSGLANMLGKGKYAEIEKKNQELEKRNKELEEASPKKLAKLQASYEQAVKEAAEKKTVAYQQKILEQQGIISSLKSDNQNGKTELNKKKKEVTDLKEQIRVKDQNIQCQIDNAVKTATFDKQKEIDDLEKSIGWRNTILSIMGRILMQSNHWFKAAIEAIKVYGKRASILCRSRNATRPQFSKEEAMPIKQSMLDFGSTQSEHIAIGRWLVRMADQQESIEGRAFTAAEKEVDDIALGRYDRRLGLDLGKGLQR